MEVQKSRLALLDLPEDITGLIFEATIDADIRGHGLACVCATLSKQVQSWIEPALYRKVEVDGDGLFHRTVTASESTKPPDFFAKHVKSLLFGFRATSKPLQIAEILEKCHSVRSLAFWGPIQRSCPELQTLLASGVLRPTHLTFGRYLLGEANFTFTHPIFPNVTHMDLICDSLPDTEWGWASLRSLKALTHLIISFYFLVKTLAPVANAVLSHCPSSLRVLALAPRLWWDLEDEEVLSMNWGEVDPRLVVVSEKPEHKSFILSLVEVGDEWGSPSATGPALWSKAEGVVRVRQEKAGA